MANSIAFAIALLPVAIACTLQLLVYIVECCPVREITTLDLQREWFTRDILRINRASYLFKKNCK